MSAAKIPAFWEWFQASEAKIRSAIDSDQAAASVLRRLDERLVKFNPKLRWEVGPGSRSPYGLVISPGGARDLIPLAEQIVSGAPRQEQLWEFHACRPPKAWNRSFELDANGRQLRVDANSWGYSLVMFKGGEFFDITLHVGDTLSSLSEPDRLSAAYILLDGELGERFVIERIGKVRVMEGPPPQPSGETGQMRAHLQQLARVR